MQIDLFLFLDEFLWDEEFVAGQEHACFPVQSEAGDINDYYDTHPQNENTHQCWTKRSVKLKTNPEMNSTKNINILTNNFNYHSSFYMLENI